MTRKEESRTISIVETGKQDGFDVRINYSVSAIGGKPDVVNSSGNKQVDGKMMSFQISTSNNGDKIEFAGMSADSAISDAILTDLRLILNKAVS